MKVLLFDFDGVIADTFSFCYQIIKTRDEITEAEYRSRFEGNINITSSPPKTPAKDGKPFDFSGLYERELLKCGPNQQLINVIKSLAQKYPLVIISSTISPTISQFLELHELRSYFKEILGNDVEKSKIKKITHVLAQYQVSPDETVLITDTLGDIREANECNVRSIAVTWGFHSLETLEKGAPYKMISDPLELLPIIESMSTEKVGRALTWISAILNKHQIPWQVTGGLAAHAYGATRPINDIDIDIPEDRFAEILTEVKPYIIESPMRIDNPVWDVYAMCLEYEGQEIDIGGANETRVKDLKTGFWHDVRVNLDMVEYKTMFGAEVPVVNKADLIEYKSYLAMPGNHQEQDIKEMTDQDL